MDRLQNPPMTYFLEKENGQLDLDGYFGKVWKELEARLNFSSVYIKSPTFATGAWNGTSWTGLIGMVVSKIIDFAVSEVTLVPERYNAVDFLRPIFITRYTEHKI